MLIEQEWCTRPFPATKSSRALGTRIAYLLFRVKDYIKSGFDKKELRDPDGGVHLARKKAELGILEEHTPDTISLFPTSGFSESLQGLPVITFKTVWTYMVTCVGAKKQLSTAKPLVKGFNFFKLGQVLTVFLFLIILQEAINQKF